MRAARLHAGSSQLQIEDVPEPQLERDSDQVLVRVAATGVCHSDLHIVDGELDDLISRPVTPGHEIAGWVEAAGSGVTDLTDGDPVAVMVGWGCGHCRWCVSGHEQLCESGETAGATIDGGFADYLLVPHRRNVVPLGEVDPLDATPFGCAALSSYAAVKRVLPHVSAGSLVAVIGLGGLGQYAVQFARALTGALVVAVEPRPEARTRALELGADAAIAPGASALAELRELSGGDGASAVIDLVGSDETLELATAVVGVRGIVALVGVAGGSVPFTFGGMAREASITTVFAGTVVDLQEVVSMAQAGRLRSDVQPRPLEDVNDVLTELREGRVTGRAAVVPGGA